MSEETKTMTSLDVAKTAVESTDVLSSLEKNHKNEHLLETPWTFYFDKRLPPQTGYKEFIENLRKLATVTTMEDMWRVYSTMTQPDSLPKDHNIFMFRHEYIPAWETFPNGGCWFIKVRKANMLVNRLWEELVFNCAGELFEDPNIVGIALSTRTRDDVISVWNKDNVRYPNVRFKIGEKLKDLLHLDPSTTVEYKHFSNSLQDGSTFRNAKTYVYDANAQPPPESFALDAPATEQKQ